ncbi:serine hydrolase [Aciduricibacillus chroicocephali]|uniref:serine-type D-Ala-D-Ala carboxypeptidase n=1 Tax=Aciduricibacillus chroicocephali TaxID=3054939 RepID=A0ABY9KUY4_9BACI|nr:serine hydrolase [Bacillaceae bacterium 44XB]
MSHVYRKVLTFVLLSLAFCILVPHGASAERTVDVKAKAAILVDEKSGKILYEKNSNTSLPPASMSKIMTEYLVWEAIKKGEIKWDTTTQISDYPYSLSANKDFSGVGLRQSKDYKVEDLYKAMAINSDNATTVALAELIAGSETDFVKRMNKKAKELGMKDSDFVNATGLDNKDLGKYRPKGSSPNETNLMSAHDAALLAYRLIHDYPRALDISSMPETDFDGQKIRNWNYMLPHDASYLKQFYYDGVDGLKTGYTDMAGYCFTGTAQRSGTRLITVVMKTASEDERFNETKKLLDYGFEQFDQKKIFPAGNRALTNRDQADKSLPVAKGKESSVPIGLKDAVEIPVKKNSSTKYELKIDIDKSKLNKDGKLEAPVKKGTKIGTAKLVKKGEKDEGYIYSDNKNDGIDVITTKPVEKDNWFMLTLKAIGHFFSNLFTTIFETIKGWF